MARHGCATCPATATLFPPLQATLQQSIAPSCSGEANNLCNAFYAFSYVPSWPSRKPRIAGSVKKQRAALCVWICWSFHALFRVHKFNCWNVLRLLPHVRVWAMKIYTISARTKNKACEEEAEMAKCKFSPTEPENFRQFMCFELIFCVVKRKHRKAKQFPSQRAAITQHANQWSWVVHRMHPRAVGETSRRTFRIANTQRAPFDSLLVVVVILSHRSAREACVSHSKIMQIFSSDSNRMQKKLAKKRNMATQRLNNRRISR